MTAVIFSSEINVEHRVTIFLTTATVNLTLTPCPWFPDIL